MAMERPIGGADNLFFTQRALRAPLASERQESQGLSSRRENCTPFFLSSFVLPCAGGAQVLFWPAAPHEPWWGSACALHGGGKTG